MINKNSFGNKYPIKKLGEIVAFLDSQRKPVKESERVFGEYPYYGANGQQGWINDYIFDEELVLLAEDGGHFYNPDRGVAYKISGKTWVNNHAHVLKPLADLDINYLYRVLENYDLKTWITGTTRPKLTKAGACEIQIPLPPLSTQIHIAQILDKADTLIRQRKLAIAKLDDLLQATFIKIFGDFNDFKNSEIALSDISIINPKQVQKNIPDNIMVSFMPMADINSDEVFAKNLNSRTYAEVKKGFTFFNNNDILLAKITPCFENGKIAIANINTEIGFGSTEFHVIHAHDKNLVNFLGVFLRQTWVRELGEKQMTGSAGQKRIPKSFVENLPVPKTNDEDIEKFNIIFDYIKTQKASLQIQLKELETLFLALQQKAFNGELIEKELL